MEPPGFVEIAHLDLSVSDVEASAAWYERVLGLGRVRRVELPERTMIVLRHVPGTVRPLDGAHGAYALIEVASARPDADTAPAGADPPHGRPVSRSHPLGGRLLVPA